MNLNEKSLKHYAILVGSLEGGGAQTVLLNLAKAFGRIGHKIDLLVFSKTSKIENIENNIRVVTVSPCSFFTFFKHLLRLPFKSLIIVLISLFFKKRKKFRSLPNILNYLSTNNPDVLISSITLQDLVAMWAKYLQKGNTRFIIRLANSIEWSKNSKDYLERRYHYLVRYWYPMADKIISVSRGLADEIAQLTELPEKSFTVINNPVDNIRIGNLAAQDVKEPWFSKPGPPVLITTARLHPQKDYPTLIRAFSILRKKRAVRLLILGEGSERDKITEMIEVYGLQNDIRLLGYQKNPHAYVARSDVFVLSSVWEGFSNSLVEALSCGTKIVSTDCKHGTREILDSGRYGKLVPVADPKALANSLYEALQENGNPNFLKKRAKDFDINIIADTYLESLF